MVMDRNDRKKVAAIAATAIALFDALDDEEEEESSLVDAPR